MTEYIFIGGKGGVGKTSIASALALSYSENNKVLLVSTDPVFALSDLWGVELTNEPKQIAENLFAKHINPDFHKGKSTSSPCASEKAALSEFAAHLLSDEYNKIVFDTAPTGHTLLLLKSPAEWKDFVKTSPLACGSEDGDEEKYEEIMNILKSNRTTFNFVLIPEKLSVEETKRAVADLQELGMKRFGFIINMVIPPDEVKDNALLASRFNMQKTHIREVQTEFGCCYKFVYLQDSEVKGKERLNKISAQIVSKCCG